jgi:hypothetical protein
MTVPATQGFSSFTVELVDDGQTTIYNNSGNGFPVEMDLIPQASLSCGYTALGKGYTLNLTVAVCPNPLPLSHCRT